MNLNIDPDKHPEWSTTSWSIPDYPTISDGLLDRGHATASALASLGGEGDAVAEILDFLKEISSMQRFAGTLFTLSWAMRRALLEDQVSWLVDTFKEARRLAEPIVPLFSTLSLADGDGAQEVASGDDDGGDDIEPGSKRGRSEPSHPTSIVGHNGLTGGYDGLVPFERMDESNEGALVAEPAESDEAMVLLDWLFSV
ncbi:hypothetical protein HK405_002716 [Cladochytrium tenue]|nr:hypothetical protein HK405_002716 [Cladochytrium tenue]